MQRLRPAAAAAALCLLAVACSSPKDTGLPASPTPTPPGKTNVQVIDSSFDPPELTVKPGDKVTWVWVGVAPHSVTSVAGLFDSHPGCAQDTTKCSKAAQDPFIYTFAKAGEFPYYCVIHGTKTGTGMFGKIIVKA